MKRVLITGCSTGIGRATALELTRRGYEVIASARRPETLTGLPVTAMLPLDVDDQASVDAAVAAAGDIDVLVNNAAWGIAGPIERVPLERTRAMFETNVFGVIRLTQAVVPQMRERGAGAIVNISSGAGRISTPLNGYYAATKHAIEAISEAMYYELGHFRIRVAIVEPGAIATSWDENEEWAGVDSAPYDDLFRQMRAGDGNLGDGDPLPGPEVVAQTIAEAIETAEPKLRWPVGANIGTVLAARARMDDATFEKAFRASYKLQW